MRRTVDKILANNLKITPILVWIYNNIVGCNRIYIYSKNSINIKNAFIKKSKFIIKGANNIVIVKDLSKLKNCKIYINGNNNEIVINKNVNLNCTELHIEDDRNKIFIGDNTTVYGNTHIAAIEGTTVNVGNDCMFANDIDLRTGDSHSIVGLNGKRLNLSESINIGDHVWVCTKVTCLKGTNIPSNSIIGACSIVTDKFYEENIILAGSPAKIVKNEINWLRERII